VQRRIEPGAVAILVVLAATLTLMSLGRTVPSGRQVRPEGLSAPGLVTDGWYEDGEAFAYLCHPEAGCTRGTLQAEAWAAVRWRCPEDDCLPSVTHGTGKGVMVSGIRRFRIDQVIMERPDGTIWIQTPRALTRSSTSVSRIVHHLTGNANLRAPDAPCSYRVRVDYTVHWTDGTLDTRTLRSGWINNEYKANFTSECG
jgi:hypothetical protein